MHVDANWVFLLTSGSVDSETSRKVYHFVQNLFHGLSMYTSVVIVGRLAGVVGPLLWILCGMSLLAPIVFALVLLLVDLTLSYDDRHTLGTSIGIATGKMVLLHLLPLGMLLAWCVGQCKLPPSSRKSTREIASTLIAVVLLLHHIINIVQWAIYLAQKYEKDFDQKVGSKFKKRRIILL